MPTIKTLTNIKADIIVAEYNESVGIRQTINHVANGKFIRQISIGNSGIMISKGRTTIAIPIEEIMKAAAAAEPLLNPDIPEPSSKAPATAALRKATAPKIPIAPITPTPAPAPAPKS